MPWTLLAGIGRVESDHGRHDGSVLGADGVSHPLIIGVPLNGVGPVAAIRDTDDGRWDKDTVWDRAVGPMQFIPSSWSAVARDGDGDGVKSPNDIDDAALGTAAYLCSGSGSVLGEDAMRAAIYTYNHSQQYVALVMAMETGYRTGVWIMPTFGGPRHHGGHHAHGHHGGGGSPGAGGLGRRVRVGLALLRRRLDARWGRLGWQWRQWWLGRGWHGRRRRRHRRWRWRRRGRQPTAGPARPDDRAEVGHARCLRERLVPRRVGARPRRRCQARAGRVPDPTDGAGACRRVERAGLEGLASDA